MKWSAKRCIFGGHLQISVKCSGAKLCASAIKTSKLVFAAFGLWVILEERSDDRIQSSHPGGVPLNETWQPVAIVVVILFEEIESRPYHPYGVPG